MVKVRRRKGREGFQVDILLRFPDGRRMRERVKPPVATHAAALRWGMQREAFLLAGGAKPETKKRALANAPTLDQFWPRFMGGYARANQEKPSNLDTRERLYRLHLKPKMGELRLDTIDDEQVQRLKGRMSTQKPKSVNNVLTVLSTLLKAAVDWRVIPTMPCRIRLLKTAMPVVEFYEDEEYERLVDAAEKVDARVHIAVLLGGDAGLRRGEIVGLEWSDVDFGRGLLKVRRSIWNDVESLPKGGKPRVVPMTSRLKAALAAHRHLRGERVLYGGDGAPADIDWLHWQLDVAQRRAGLRRGGRVHILRHTFCSRLAARNVPMLAIKDLAGHASIETTMRYMHLSSAAPREGIAALEVRGTRVAPATLVESKSSEIN